MKRAWISFVCLLFAALPAQATPPELLLLTKYRPGTDVRGWYMSEKLDGVRGYWDGESLLSRQGKPFAAPAWFTEKLPPFALDGELWISRGRFEEAQSITAKSQPHLGWGRLTYHIFEVPHAPGGLDSRLERLRAYLRDSPIDHVKIIPQVVLCSVEHLNAQLETVDSKGGEGLVLRNPASPYETGRTSNALKVKRFDDMEGRVVGYRTGKGKYTGMTGALWVEIDEGKRFYIGSGLSDRDRVEPPALGSVITFKHQGFTPNGIPRFASFLRVRQVP